MPEPDSKATPCLIAPGPISIRASVHNAVGHGGKKRAPGIKVR